MGVKCDLLDAADVRKIEPTLTTDVGGALQIDTHGFVVASDLSGALSAAAIRHGARVRVPGALDGFNLSSEDANAIVMKARVKIGWIEELVEEEAAEEFEATGENAEGEEKTEA